MKSMSIFEKNPENIFQKKNTYKNLYNLQTIKGHKPFSAKKGAKISHLV
jgi:hypothetical protein